MTSTRIFGFQPKFHDLHRKFGTYYPAAHCDNVRVVVLLAGLRAEKVVNDCRADTFDLVCGNRNTDARAAKEIRLKAESEADVILKQAAKDSKDATRLRQNNAEVAAQRKTEMIAREGNKEISDFISKCVVNEDAAVETVKEKLFTKYGNR